MITLADSSIETANMLKVGAGKRSDLPAYLASLFCGALLGLSAPGFEQWYLAWIGFVPLILLVISSRTVWQSFFRGLLFGAGYHFVYLNWVFGLHPLDWLHFSAWQSCLLAAGALTVWSLHQALLVSIFAAICRLMPLTASLKPKKLEGRWHWPALLVIPTFWVLWMGKIGNAHSLLGVPWGMLEYSQYKQQFIIQVASIIGGVGIGFLIVLFNTALASAIATFSGKNSWHAVAHPNRAGAIYQLTLVSVILTVTFAAGFSQVQSISWTANQTVSILQSNINFTMFRGTHMGVQNIEIPFFSMITQCPPGLCLAPEGALPFELQSTPSACEFLGDLAKKNNLDIVLGCLHTDRHTGSSQTPGLPPDHDQWLRYNSASAVKADGTLLNRVYYKRFLVPFSEYSPRFVQLMKQWLPLPRQWKVKNVASGSEPILLKLSCGLVAPLMCVECMSPELAVASTKAGGQLIVTLANPSFLHDSMVGTQMLAFNVFRAVENRRFVVFACNTGPSAIIDPCGRIIVKGEHGKEQLLVGRVGFNSNLTPFCRWFSCLGRL